MAHIVSMGAGQYKAHLLLSTIVKHFTIEAFDPTQCFHCNDKRFDLSLSEH